VSLYLLNYRISMQNNIQDLFNIKFSHNIRYDIQYLPIRPERPGVRSVQVHGGPKFWGAHNFQISLLYEFIQGIKIGKKQEPTLTLGRWFMATCPRPAWTDFVVDPDGRLYSSIYPWNALMAPLPGSLEFRNFWSPGHFLIGLQTPNSQRQRFLIPDC
jgi:hypothetical protein